MKTEKLMKCGLIMPISAIDGCSEAHWEEVSAIVKEALIDTPFQVELVSDSNEIGIIQKRIVQNIYDNDVVICDVSAKNPNVMFELGMRLAFDKPAIIIKDDKTNYSFDTSPIEHLEYPRDLHYHSIQSFKLKLRDKIVATYEASKRPEYTTFLKHFGQFVVAKLDEKRVGTDEYILAELTELKNELRLVAKQNRGREEGLDELFRRNPYRHPSSTGVFVDPVPLMTEMEYVQMLKVNNVPGLIKEELSSPSSKAFNDLLEDYLSKYVPAGIARKPRHQEMIAKNLLMAIETML